MEPQEYAAMRRVEDSHWWYQTLHARVLDALTRHAPAASGRLLDAGCGTGGMLAKVPASWRCHGLDASSLAMGAARERALPCLVQGSVLELPYPTAYFDVVLSLDVIYHRAVAEPVGALREIRRVLRPGGIVIINVPAYDALRSSHDQAIHTARRFNRETLGGHIAEAGLRPLHLGHWNSLLLVPAVALRLWRAAFPRPVSDVAPPSAWMQALGGGLCALERRYAPALPAGLSVFAVCTTMDGAAADARGESLALRTPQHRQ